MKPESDKTKTPKNNKIKRAAPPCESCVHYDVIDEDGTLGCTVNFDEDEMYSFVTARSGCPHYKFYDEYTSVRKQN